MHQKGHLLHITTPKDLEMVQSLEDLKCLYPDLLHDSYIGTIPDDPYKTNFDKSVPPKCTASHLVPVYQQNAFHEEISKMLNVGTVAPVEKVIPWMSSLVIMGTEGNKQKKNQRMGHNDVQSDAYTTKKCGI